MPSLGRVECLMRISRWPQFQAEVAQFQAEVVAVAGSPVGTWQWPIPQSFRQMLQLIRLPSA